MTSPADRRTFHTEARARATRTWKTPVPTVFSARHCSAISCLRSPGRIVTGLVDEGQL
jgi:hypothetical protein